MQTTYISNKSKCVWRYRQVQHVIHLSLYPKKLKWIKKRYSRGTQK